MKPPEQMTNDIKMSRHGLPYAKQLSCESADSQTHRHTDRTDFNLSTADRGENHRK